MPAPKTVLTAIALCGVAVAQANPDLSITWVGQSCFVMRGDGGPTVVTDPPVASVGYTLPQISADAVTITHNHTDHNNSAGVGGKFTLIDGRPVTARQQIAAGSLTFTLIPGFHDNQNGALRGPNTMMRWNQAGLEIAHLGDLGQDQLTPAQLADLQNLDILFIPAGGFFTITPERAAGYVNELKPRVAILMHYRTALGGPAQLAALPDAAAPFSRVVYKPATVTVNRGTLPPSTEVWVMQPLSDTVAVNSASFSAGTPVAPGSIATLFGKIAGSQTAAAGSYPLPRKLGETEVFVNGTAAPLYYASPAQINLQVPSALATGQALAEVRIGGQAVARVPVTVLPNAPGLFAVTNQDGRLNTSTAPARRGQVLHIYGTGVGAVSPAVEDGAAAPAGPLAIGVVTPNVFLGTRQLVVEFSGLVPGTAGGWQIDVALPNDAPTGSNLSLVVVNGLTSNPIPVTVIE
jgi:uncharacterized protein (TIGR03437 family)